MPSENKYRDIVNLIDSRIRSGHYQADEVLPTSHIREEYYCSHAIALTVLAILAERKLVFRKHGSISWHIARTENSKTKASKELTCPSCDEPLAVILRPKKI